MSKVEIIGAASGLAAQDLGTGDGPEALKASKDLQELLKNKPDWAWHSMIKPSAPQQGDATIITDFCQKIANDTVKVIQSGAQFAVLGGDHACAIGTWSGAAHVLREQGDLGLLWIDAHLDAHTHDTSPSSAIHGMPVACLLGHGEQRLTHILDKRAKIKPEHLCIVGARSFEAGEKALLERLNVRVYYMDEVLARGTQVVMREALAQVSQASAGYGISLDLDAIDPIDAPGIGSPESEGIRAQALCEALTQVHAFAGLIGFEITEFNPHHDQNRMTEKLVSQLLMSVLD